MEYIITAPLNRDLKLSREQLIKLYIEEDLRISDIANKFNISKNTVSKYIKKFNIPTKRSGHYKISDPILFTKEQYEFFDGLMISDGSLVVARSGGKSRNAKISCAFKYREFAQYINEYLDLNGNIHNKIHYSNRYKSGKCEQYGLFSKNNVTFTEERNRWYPYGTKVIPYDFRFSPVSILVMYLGDGNYNNGKVNVALNSFDRKDIEHTLVPKFEDNNILVSIHKNNNLYILKNSVDKFFKYIGSCPINCYKYKWGG